MILGVDIGTGSLELVAYEKDGTFVGRETSSYPLMTPHSGYSEQNPSDWIHAFKKSLERLLKNHPKISNELEAIGISGQMHTLVLVDKHDEVIRPAILWNDVRCSSEVKMINQTFDVIKSARNKPLEGFTLPKLLWVKNNEPLFWDKISKVFLPSSYLSYSLTGQAFIDYSEASGTLLLDFDINDWNKDILEWLELPLSTLPNLTWASENQQKIKTSIKKELGLGTQDIFVFSGSADNAASSLAAGISKENQAMLSIGTSGVLLSIESDKQKSYDGELHFFHHVLKDNYYSMGVTLSAGQSLKWYKENFFPEENYDKILGTINAIPAGSDGLIFAPYIMGERTPHTDSKIRGSFIGLDIRHTPEHLTRAVLEGICFSLKDSQMIMLDENKQFDEIITVGGGSINQNWLQIQADIFNVPIKTLSGNHGPSLGAVMIAAIGMKYYDNTNDLISTFVKYSETYAPIKENVALYEKMYHVFRLAYSNTKEMCHKLDAIK